MDYKTATLQTILNLCKTKILYSKNIKRYITHGQKPSLKLIKQIHSTSVTLTFSGASLCCDFNNLKFWTQEKKDNNWGTEWWCCLYILFAFCPCQSEIKLTMLILKTEDFFVMLSNWTREIFNFGKWSFKQLKNEHQTSLMSFTWIFKDWTFHYDGRKAYPH